MAEPLEYVVYDYKRRRTVMEFQAFSDAMAIADFSAFVLEVVGGANWEHRQVDRYYLVRVDPNDTPIIFEDWQVRLSFQRFLLADPPGHDDDMAEIESEFARLDGIDVARIERRSNRPKVA